MIRAVLVCAVLFATETGAFEHADVRGLHVQIERINEPVNVDGVPIEIQRAQGRDALLLAQRVERRWRGEAGQVTRMHQSGWQMVTHWLGGRSELIQWRESMPEPELLYSVVDIMRSTYRESPPPFSLPARCRWGRVIEGTAARQAFSQHSAYCQMRRGAVPDALRPHLGAQGWIVRRDTAAAIDLERDGQRGVLVLSDSGSDTALTWLGVNTFSVSTP